MLNLSQVKMKKIFIAFLFAISFGSYASHISGGQITYNCLGNNVYQVTLTYFWDCAGGFNPGTSQFIDVIGCAGGQNLSLTVNQSSLTPGDGVLAGGLCPSASTLTTCKKRIDYIGTITLPVGCSDWTFSLGSCCRGGNFSNITGGSSASYYHFATLNNILAPCNNSPDVAIEQLPNFCVNQPACFNLGATELDGNTLSYSFISAYQTSNTFVTYSGAYTGTSPMTGITIDPNTGQINFTPTTVGDFVVVVQVTEKDANGNVIGTVMRDFQVIVTNCSNQTVSCGQGNITNVTSGNVPGGAANTLQICENIPFCFDVTFTDPDVSDSIKIKSPNMSTTMPGSSMVLTYTPGVTNSIKASICWTPPAGSSGLNTNFVLVVKDNACPVSGTQILNYIIDVLPATNAGPDQTICGPQTASVNAVGSSTIFAWSDLAGNPIPVGPEFSCNPCKNPIIKPLVTTTYVVTNINGGSNCKNKDTLVINVVPDFTLSAGVDIASGCLNSAVQFTSNVSPTGGYTYSWSPSAPLTSTNSANTNATYSFPGTYNYTLAVTSSLGCKKQQTNINFVANPVVTPIFTVVPTNTTICSGSNVPLTINFDTSPPTVCGLATTGCASPNSIQVGNGTTTNGSTTYPSPYANFYDSQHFQMLFTASELMTAGLLPGKISSLAFNVTALNGITNNLKNFTIKLKCTSAINTTVFDVAGLTQVYNNMSYSSAVGWNIHNFTSGYEWDGSSNLLVDVCYDDNGVFFTNNASSPYTVTGFTSVVYYRADATNTCPLTTITSVSSNRPNVRFGNCLSAANPNSFSYSWMPTTGLNNPSIQSPTTNVTADIIYTVVVTPTAAATCSNVGTTSLTVIAPVTPSINAVGPYCSNAPSFSLTASPAGGSWGISAFTNSLGIFTPSLASVGSNTVSYTYGGVGCAQTATMVVNIEKFVPSTITGTIAPQCNTNPIINLSTALVTSTLGVGTWAGNGVSGTNFDPNVAGAGTHTISYSTNSSPTTTLCPSTSSIIVVVSSIVQPTITPAGPYCNNFGPQTMTVTPTSASGFWLTSPNANSINSTTGDFTASTATVGNNTITYTVSNGPCTASTSIVVNVVGFIPATIISSKGPYCIYDAMEDLQPIAQYTGGVWSGNGVTGSDFTPSLAGAGTHVITYSTDPVPSGLCPDSKTTNIVVNAKPQANALANIIDGCSPLQINFFTSTVNTGNATWFFSDGTTESGLNVSHLFTQPGTYSASISYTDAIGCTNDSAVANSFTVYANPIASFEPSLFETTVVDAQIEFTNQSASPNTNSYSWDIGGLATFSTTNVSYLFTDAGTYTISLLATTQNNCVDDTSIVIVVKPDVVIYVPNSFTPGNGDAINDVFQIFLPPTGVDYNTFIITIFDRWGTKVFTSNDVNKSWNGTKNNAGQMLKQDTYVWKISFKDVNRKLYEKVGYVTLLPQDH